ncbi:MAG TPA: helix-turn-helix domain-containing protein [Chitinispirillaceae bacterium]|nr:helix-turn-helix domain-containing protein [Chitinispirillaceae bacterium]
MVVNNIHSKLMEVGFSENEAKVYIALLTENPLTAYETAKHAGVPTSKVYEVISRLSERGAVFEVDHNEKRRFIPLPPDELIATHRTRVDTTLKELQEGLNTLASSSDLSFIRTIHDYGYLIDKARRIIENAADTLLISICPREMELLYPALSAAENRNVRIAVVHFGQLSKPIGKTFVHPIENTIFEEKGGQALIVSADSREVLFAKNRPDGTTEGIHSMSEGFVAMAEDFIRHDIYILKIVGHFDKSLLQVYGKNYSKLRDIYKDEKNDDLY